LRQHRRELREQHGIDCHGCVTNHPKRSPSILLPQQQCKVCGYRDQRSLLPDAAKE
jgi:rRNA maturation endonuclease Nob1